MIAAAKTGIVAVVLVVLGVAIYPSAKRMYVRHRAQTHLDDAQALRSRLTSPVAAQSLEGAIASMRLTLRGDGADTSTIQKADAWLVDVMKRVVETPPPDHPVSVEARYDTSARAGASFPVSVTIRSELPEVFIVAAIAEVDSGTGWRSGPARTQIDQALTKDKPLEARIEVPIPATAEGRLSVAVSVIYRVDATGEGRDLRERPSAALPLVMISK